MLQTLLILLSLYFTNGIWITVLYIHNKLDVWFVVGCMFWPVILINFFINFGTINLED